MVDREVLVAPGVGVHVRMTGRSDGPTLVLLHGLGDGISTWDPVMEDLSARFAVVALDLRGHGGSSRPGTTRSSRCGTTSSSCSPSSASRT